MEILIAGFEAVLFVGQQGAVFEQVSDFLLDFCLKFLLKVLNFYCLLLFIHDAPLDHVH